MTAVFYADLPIAADDSRPAASVKQALPLLFSEPFIRGPFTVYADVRIDDRKAVLAALSLPADASGSEIVLEAYIKWGEGCAKRLLGDFAFVIVDEVKKQIFCCRDYVGARALFYAVSNGRFIASNDLPFLLQQAPQLDRLDHSFAATSLVFPPQNSERQTAFAAIKRVPQACFLVVKNGEVSTSQYWSPKDAAPCSLTSDRQHIDQGRALLEAAVSDRMHGVKKSALHLSGGLDSSAVAAIVTRQTAALGAEIPLAYAWHLRKPAEPDDDTTQWVGEVRDALALPVFAPRPDTASILRLFQDDGLQYGDQGDLVHEQPAMDHAHAHGVDTIFSGWGGDQGISFNGKGHRSHLLLTLQWAALARLGGGAGHPGFSAGFRRAIAELVPRFGSRRWHERLKQSYLHPDSFGLLIGPPRISTSQIGVRARIEAMINGFPLTQRLESWSMAGRRSGLTYVYPLLDKRVAEFALGLPPHLFAREENRRWIFRQIMDPAIPDLVRLNDSKDEQARIAWLTPIMHTAFLECAAQLEAGNMDQERAGLVDLERLITDLKAPQDQALKNLFLKRQALQLLLF